ncbi:MAG TPA: hypothetical protein VGC18_05580 [Lacisediminihabitans sp.]|uniref:hypothetical protein n=1 Tax=Lacisediminihabitans sp. TaxID=2787631 RepID=UPI002EDA4BFD
MGLFSRDDDNPLPKDDRGSGSFNDYRYDLVPARARVRIRLADSNPHQEELRRLVEVGEETLETAISRRSIEDERTDAPMLVRLFAGTRVSGVVGTVPRGLEPIVDEALSRLDKRGQKVRIPVKLAKERGALRVDLLIGQTR